MRSTRKRTLKPVYKNEDENDSDIGDFSDSGSDAVISPPPSSEEDEESAISSGSGDEFKTKNKQKSKNRSTKKQNIKFTKRIINKINKQCDQSDEIEGHEKPELTVKDLTDADKLLPFLNLSESDSSDDDESMGKIQKTHTNQIFMEATEDSEREICSKLEYRDVWSNNEKPNSSEDIAKKAFLELEQHKKKIEEAQQSINNYNLKNEKQLKHKTEETNMSIENNKLKNDNRESNVNDLLALGEEVSPTKIKLQSRKYDSDSEVEDWEEVNEAKSNIPQQGLQLVLDIPGAVCRKSKKVDVEMMMKRKLNRAKKEQQVYMHKVHVLCWLGHGNFISRVLNDQSMLAATLSLVPSKECYPGERVDMKYLEQITSWYHDKVTLKQDKHENKFRPKAKELRIILLEQIKKKVFTTKKYIVFVFVSMLRALGLQCRVLLNFVAVPIRPPNSELCSLSTKVKDESIKNDKQKSEQSEPLSKTTKLKKNRKHIASDCNDMDNKNISQLDGNDDKGIVRTRKTRNVSAKQVPEHHSENEDVSPPKRSKRKISPNKNNKSDSSVKTIKDDIPQNERPTRLCKNQLGSGSNNGESLKQRKSLSLNKEKHDQIENRDRKTQNSTTKQEQTKTSRNNRNSKLSKASVEIPIVTITNEKMEKVSSEYFEEVKKDLPKSNKRQTRNSKLTASGIETTAQTKRSPKNKSTTSEFFDKAANDDKSPSKLKNIKNKSKDKSEDSQRISHRDIKKTPTKSKTDVTSDLISIIKHRVKDAKEESNKGKVKGKVKKESEDDSDYLPVESPKRRKSCSEDDFKPSKVSPRPTSSKKIDRRVLSADEDELPLNKIDVWCEVFVEELEEWVAVDVVRGKVHCTNEIYSKASHPVNYVVGWDNNNYLKDLTRRYVPHWNTVTRKQRVDMTWWNAAVNPWLGPKSARDKEEDERLDRMQLEAPLPKTISEYKNHPLYALKRHLLKFEALFPPDASVLGFVRGEPVYARECVHVCRSRDTWMKEAKVVRLGEKPYKVVKARPKWDKLSNKMITDKPLEVFGPWQVQDYEPPTAVNGTVPRNAYGNVELFKECMLPKGTVHIKLPSLNRIAKKLNIDCAPAMTGFDFNGGYTHPVYDGFVVCQEFEEIITEAWIKDQEELEIREREKTDARVYGHWKRLIKGLFIRERLKAKYGFEEPSTSKNEKKSKGPRFVIAKRNV